MIAPDLSIAALARGWTTPPWYRGLLIGATPPALALDFTRSSYAKAGQAQALDTLFGLSRTDVKTAYSAQGAIRVTPVDTPSLDHDPLTGTPWGLRLDPASQNLLIQTRQPHLWAQPVGTGITLSMVSDFGAADGASAVDQTASGDRPYLEQSVSVTAGTPYCFSLYIEDITGGASWDQIAGMTGLAGLTPSYRVQGVPVPGSDPAQAGLLEVTATAPSAGLLTVQMGLGIAGPATGHLRLSRPQLEQGSARAPFIPTGGATETRAQDLMAATTLSWLSGAAGTIQTRVTLSEARNNYPVLWSLEAGGDTLRLLLRKSNNRLVLQAKRGSSYFQTERNSPGFHTPFTVAASWEANRLALAVGGSAVASWSGTLSHPGFTSATLGNAGNGSLPMSLWMERFVHWPVAAGNGDLQTLSA
jgi:hypothetical protein